MSKAEAIVCSACAICFFPLSLPIICVEHCIQCENASNGITPTYPYPVKACCKNGSYFPCCYYTQPEPSDEDAPPQKVMASPPRTPTKKINSSIYSSF